MKDRASFKQAQISHELSRYTPPSHKYLSLSTHLSAIHRRPEIDPFVIHGNYDQRQISGNNEY